MAALIQSRARRPLGMNCDATRSIGRHRLPDSPFGWRLSHAVLGCLLTLLLFLPSSLAQARTVNAASPSLIDVIAAIHSAADGDTVTIPKGTAAWTSTIKISKGITLMGQTTTDPVHKTADDQTIISANTGANGDTPLIVLNTTLGKSYRVSGITFRTGRTGVVNSNGMVQLNGSSQAVRLDHCHFDDLAYENNNIAVWGAIYGVIDHNLFDFRTSFTQSIFLNMGNWGGQSTDGDGSWIEPPYNGSEKFVFIEDNCFNNTRGDQIGGGIDAERGARFVIRYNHFYGMGGVIGSHGTEVGRYRGVRAVEVYNNDFHWTNRVGVGGIRSGSIISHDNTHDGQQPDNLTLGQYRMFIDNNHVFGGSTGDNPWDYNATEPDGRHIDGHPPCLFDSGTAQAASGRNAIVDRAKNWPTNRWTGYTAKRVADGRLALIAGNTNNTLNVLYHDGYGGGTTWQAGDQYQIHKVIVSMDQPCRGAGDLIISNLPVNKTTGTASWPHQALEPCYSWNDIYTPTGAGVNITTASGAFAVLQEGRDFYNNTPMPRYIPYTYPHPLTISLPQSQLSPDSQRHVNESSERTDRKVKTWKWGKAKENSTSKTAKQVAPGQ
jgi:hypothetical protein